MCPTSQKPVIIDTLSSNNPPESFPEPSYGNTTWRTLLSAPNTPTDAMSVGIAFCPPSGTLSLHRHKQSEIYYVLSGTGEVEIDGQRNRVSEGMVLWIPGDAEHGVFCNETDELKWLYVFPEGNFEHVIYRFSHEKGESRNQALAKL
ncbi:RmlC-like cupin domain-containing protein [Dactylonectria estremocensis]|uniref:RmlC-like cupin domain-containing protein n=1 Tax=Dactylonectria estremocensis TaxID=1079267 RepID=A0A9P9EPL6_9HYPO|nr:RmlC-like cupin domain-containing protein [Dactylonectria estremocensis]